jgi:hypothetical protein
MHVRLFFFSLAFLSIATIAASQDQPVVRRPDSSPSQVVRRPDGGAYGPMQSIFIPPKPGAPFSLTLATEWTRPMGNGGTFTLVNERHIVRDSKGRIYQERWILVPKGGKVKSEMNVFQITDPDLHTWFNCEVRTKVCELLEYRLTATQNYQPPIGPSGPLPNGNGFRTHEDLGEGNTLGVDTHGYRETLTINEGVMGNDKPMVNMREFWYSTHLGVNLISIVDEPQSGRQVFTVKDLSTSEPEPSYFLVPAGYTVVDHRKEATE